MVMNTELDGVAIEVLCQSSMGFFVINFMCLCEEINHIMFGALRIGQKKKKNFRVDLPL